MRVYRLIRARWVNQALTGEGARRYGSRWNPKGVPMIYTASTLSLAALETLVHFAIDTAPVDYVALTIRVPDDAVEQVDHKQLPADWYATPPPVGCQQVGARWAAEAQSLGLAVPSTVVPTETNIVLNPLHPDFPIVTLEKQEPFLFDSRLLPAR
ncbi:MAG: RES family NAD+ phosphorylase [Polyangiales bacterium]